MEDHANWKQIVYGQTYIHGPQKQTTKQAQLGVPHSRIQVEVELRFILQAVSYQILDFAQNQRQNQRGKGTELHLGGVTPPIKNIYTYTYFIDVGNNWGGEWGHFTTLKEKA